MGGSLLFSLRRQSVKLLLKPPPTVLSTRTALALTVFWKTYVAIGYQSVTLFKCYSKTRIVVVGVEGCFVWCYTSSSFLFNQSINSPIASMMLFSYTCPSVRSSRLNLYPGNNCLFFTLPKWSSPIPPASLTYTAFANIPTPSEQLCFLSISIP